MPEVVVSRARRLVPVALACLVAASVAAPGHAAPGDRPTPADDGGGTPTPSVYGLDNDEELETLPPLKPPKPPAPPTSPSPANTHIVKRGDSLSKISRTHFHDRYQWPKIWALNPEITNPNLIFPGQALRLSDVRPPPFRPVAAPTAKPKESEATASSPPPTSVLPPRPVATSSEMLELRQIGFVDEGELKAAGIINGSIEEKILLGSGDHAYVEFPDDKVPKGGTRYTIYQVDQEHPIREPLSQTVLGYLVHVYGDVIVDEATDRPVANARLVDLVAPVERGYRVGPHIRRLRSVRPKHNEYDMTARIVASVEPNILIANAMFVVLNRGSRHGVELGNRFLVLRQGDGIKRVMEDWEASDHRFPPHAVAEIVAVDVQNETTIGWISRGTRELHTGDVADLRRGY